METQNVDLVARQLQKKIEDLAAQLDEAKATQSQIELLQHYQRSQKSEGMLFHLFFDNVPQPSSKRTLSYAEKLDRLKFYRGEDLHEWNLLANRLNSYIFSQSFLVAAYATAMNNDRWPWQFSLIFPVILSIGGIYASVRIYAGIHSAISSVEHWHEKEDHLLADDDFFREAYKSIGERRGDPGWRHKHYATAAPWLFGTGWILLLLLTIYLHLPPTLFAKF